MIVNEYDIKSGAPWTAVPSTPGGYWRSRIYWSNHNEDRSRMPKLLDYIEQVLQPEPTLPEVK